MNLRPLPPFTNSALCCTIMMMIAMTSQAATLQVTSGPTTGGINVTIVTEASENFEAQGPNSTVFVGTFEAITINSWTMNSIEFVLPEGAGAALTVTVTTQSLLDIFSSNTFSYAAPVMFSLSPTHGPTTGGDLDITGLNFGPSFVLDTIMVGNNLATNVTHTHTFAEGVVPPGTGIAKQVKIKVAGQSSNIIFYNYDPPTYTNVAPNNGPAAGGNTVILTGTNFGPAGTSASVNIGSAPATNVTVLSHTSLSFTAPPGVGGNKTITVIIDGQSSSTGPTYSYNPPVVNSISPDSGATTGGYLITILGHNFGPSGTPANVNIGSYIATNVIVVSDSVITCIVPPGFGANHSVSVSVAGQPSNQNETFSYFKPQIAQLAPNNGPTSGGTFVIAAGSNFGPAGTPALVLVGGNVATEVTVINHTTLSFKTPPGVGTDVPVTVSIGGQTSTDDITFDYQAPMIAFLSPTSGPTPGGTLVSVGGNNFGPPGTVTYVTVDGDSATSVIVQSHTALTFITPEGSGLNNDVRVIINEQTSNAALFSYLPPSIFSVSPISGPEQGGTLVTLTGINFGPTDAPTSVSVGGQPATNITHVSHNSITFLTPPGTGAGKIIQLTVDGQITTAPITYSYIPTVYPGVGIGTTEVAPSALLEIQSSSQGILIPRMSTAARLAITSPAEGLLVYDSTEHTFYFYNGTIWKKVGME